LSIGRGSTPTTGLASDLAPNQGKLSFISEPSPV